MLAKHNIKSVSVSPRKTDSYLSPVKDTLGLRTPDVYSIPSEVGRFILDKEAVLFKLESKNTIDTYK